MYEPFENFLSCNNFTRRSAQGIGNVDDLFGYIWDLECIKIVMEYVHRLHIFWFCVLCEGSR